MSGDQQLPGKVGSEEARGAGGTAPSLDPGGPACVGSVGAGSRTPGEMA